MASVTKRPRTRADGKNGDKWIVRFVDHTGKHRQTSFDRKKDADAYRSQIENEARQGLLAPDARKVTVKSAIDAFLSHQLQRKRDGRIGETHRRCMDNLLHKHALPALGNYKLADINLSVLAEWHSGLLDRAALGPVTARTMVRYMSRVFEFAMRREWMHRNPAALLLGEMRGMKPTRVKTFSIDDIKKVLIAANIRRYRGVREDAHMRLLCVIHLSAFCGLRLGEIFGLHMDQIDFGRNVINIETSLSKVEGIKSPKSKAGIRTIAMPQHVAALLAAWIDNHMTAAANGSMFRARDGRAISMCGFRRSTWGALLERAGFPREEGKPAFRIHAMRHFAASWMIDAGWSLPEVAMTLGHAKVDVTLSVYAHALSHKSASQPQMQALADRLLLPPIAA